MRRWSASPGMVDADVLAVVRSARRDGWRVGLLTNATTRLRSDLARLDLLDEFDLILNSSELGVCKPDPRVFHEACRHLAVEPEDCLFVDDTPSNVTAASAIGLNGIDCQDAPSLAVALGMG